MVGKSGLGFFSEPDGVPTATRAARANRNFIDLESGGAQSFGEFFVGMRRPDRKNAAGFQSGFGSGQSGRAVELVVAFMSQTFRAIVDIEQDGIINCRFSKLEVIRPPGRP